jgi:DNA-binding NtrC family response regulator
MKDLLVWIRIAVLRLSEQDTTSLYRALAAIEIEVIRQARMQHKTVADAARALSMKRTTLFEKIRRYNEERDHGQEHH